jgi:phenylalanyl-tRNA synthetase alpha chain
VIEALGHIREEVLASLSKVHTEKEITDIRVKILGRKGSLTQLLKQLGALPEAERKEIGKKANEIKEALESQIEEALVQLKE